MIPQYPNDRDYFFDTQENIYQVIGYVHPSDFVCCLEKYTKINEDNENFQGQVLWKSAINNKTYTRNISMYSSKIATSLIQKSNYKKFSKLYGVEFIHFPKDEIQLYLDPREKLKNLRNQVRTTFLSLSDQARNAIEISHIIEQELGIDSENMGVTGSILWKGVHSNSDIDLIIYGIGNTRRFLRGIYKLIQANKKFRSPPLTEQMKWAGRFSQKSGMSLEDCTVSIAHKRFLLYFSKYYLSIAFSPTKQEILQNTLAKEGTQFINIPEWTSVTIQATVKDDKWMYFYPGVIYLENVKIKHPSQKITENPTICRAVVFEHENIGYYEIGNEIEICGLVQQIQNPTQDVITKTYSTTGSAEKYAQIIVGTSENYGKEYIKNLGI